MATDQGIDGLVAFVASRAPGDRNKGLFWAACRAAEDGLDMAPLAEAATRTGIPRDAVESTLASAARTIERARRRHEPLSPAHRQQE